MVLTAIKERVLSDLNRLSPAQQIRAAELVHGLVPRPTTGALVEDLQSIAGILDEESAIEMMQAIEKGCERVDPDAW